MSLQPEIRSEVAQARLTSIEDVASFSDYWLGFTGTEVELLVVQLNNRVRFDEPLPSL